MIELLSFIERNTLETSLNGYLSLKTCICKLHTPFTYLHVCKNEFLQYTVLLLWFLLFYVLVLNVCAVCTLSAFVYFSWVWMAEWPSTGK